MSKRYTFKDADNEYAIDFMSIDQLMDTITDRLEAGEDDRLLQEGGVIVMNEDTHEYDLYSPIEYIESKSKLICLKVIKPQSMWQTLFELKNIFNELRGE